MSLLEFSVDEHHMILYVVVGLGFMLIKTKGDYMNKEVLIVKQATEFLQMKERTYNWQNRGVSRLSRCPIGGDLRR
jgi:hypothetical protein